MIIAILIQIIMERWRSIWNEFWKFYWIWNTIQLKITRLKIRYAIGQKARKELLSWVFARVPKCYVEKDFPICFQDGVALCALVDKLKHGACPRYDVLDPEKKLRNIQLAFQLLEKYIGVKPETSAEEMLERSKSSDEKWLFLMAQIKMAVDRAPPQQLMSPFSCGPPRCCLARGMGLVYAMEKRRASFSILVDSMQQDLDMVIEIRGPNDTLCSKRLDRSMPEDDDILVDEVLLQEILRKKIPLTYHFQGSRINVCYFPLESGSHCTSILWKGQHISGSPYTVHVEKPVDWGNGNVWRSPHARSNSCPNGTNFDFPNNLKSVNFMHAPLLESKFPRTVRKKVLCYIVKAGEKDIVVKDPEHLGSIVHNLRNHTEFGPLKKATIEDKVTDILEDKLKKLSSAKFVTPKIRINSSDGVLTNNELTTETSSCIGQRTADARRNAYHSSRCKSSTASSTEEDYSNDSDHCDLESNDKTGSNELLANHLHLDGRLTRSLSLDGQQLIKRASSTIESSWSKIHNDVANMYKLANRTYLENEIVLPFVKGIIEKADNFLVHKTRYINQIIPTMQNQSLENNSHKDSNDENKFHSLNTRVNISLSDKLENDSFDSNKLKNQETTNAIPKLNKLEDVVSRIIKDVNKDESLIDLSKQSEIEEKETIAVQDSNNDPICNTLNDFENIDESITLGNNSFEKDPTKDSDDICWPETITPVESGTNKLDTQITNTSKGCIKPKRPEDLSGTEERYRNTNNFENHTQLAQSFPVKTTSTDAAAAAEYTLIPCKKEMKGDFEMKLDTKKLSFCSERPLLACIRESSVENSLELLEDAGKNTNGNSFFSSNEANKSVSEGNFEKDSSATKVIDTSENDVTNHPSSLEGYFQTNLLQPAHFNKNKKINVSYNKASQEIIYKSAKATETIDLSKKDILSEKVCDCTHNNIASKPKISLLKDFCSHGYRDSHFIAQLQPESSAEGGIPSDDSNHEEECQDCLIPCRRCLKKPAQMLPIEKVIPEGRQRAR